MPASISAGPPPPPPGPPPPGLPPLVINKPPVALKEVGAKVAQKALERLQRVANVGYDIEAAVQKNRKEILEQRGIDDPAGGKEVPSRPREPSPAEIWNRTKKLPSVPASPVPEKYKFSKAPSSEIVYLPAPAPSAPAPAPVKNPVVGIAKTAIKYVPRPSLPIPSTVRTVVSCATLGALYT